MEKQVVIYRYQLCNRRQNKRLHRLIDLNGDVWNEAVTRQRKSMNDTGNLITRNELTRQLRELRRDNPAFTDWKVMFSASIPYVSDRLEKAWKRCFKKLAKQPRFKRRGRAKSFVIAKPNWALLPNKKPKIGQIRIGRNTYIFHHSRPIPNNRSGTLTIKRTADGKLWLVFVCDLVASMLKPLTRTGKTCGLDFGLKTYLTTDNGDSIPHPQYRKQSLSELRVLSRNLSLKAKGSNNWKRAKLALARHHIDTANKLADFQWKLAWDLCRKYDTIYIEDLSFRGMMHLWGRKVGDLAHYTFLQKLEWIATKTGKQVIKIDRFYPSSKLCSSCGHKQDMKLWDRTFDCSECGTAICRDWNAAINIKEAGERLLQESRKTGLVPQAC